MPDWLEQQINAFWKVNMTLQRLLLGEMILRKPHDCQSSEHENFGMYRSNKQTFN